MKARFDGLVMVYSAALLLSAVTARDTVAQNAGKTTLKEMEERVTVLKAELDALTGKTSGQEARHQIDELAARIAVIQSGIESLRVEQEATKNAAAEAASQAEEMKEAMERLTKETAMLKARLAEEDANPRAGYTDGFFITTKDRRFGLKINGFIRPRYAFVLERQWDMDDQGNILPGADRDTPDRVLTQNGFDIQSARVIVGITAAERLELRAEVDYGQASDAPLYSKRLESPIAEGLIGDRPLSSTLRLLDLFGAYTPFPFITARAGQFKVGFDKESSFLPTERPFTAGSLLSRRYRVFGDLPRLTPEDIYYRYPIEVERAARFGRDVGAEIEGRLFDERLSIRAGVFNGAGVGRENDNRDVLTALRIEGAPFGTMSSGVFDADTAEAPLLVLGGGAAFDLSEHQSAYADTRYNSADLSTTLDAHIKWQGASALATIFYRRSDHGGGRFEVDGDTLRGRVIHALGGMVQLAYHHAGTRLTPAVRYSVFDSDLDRTGNHAHQATAALTFGAVPEHLRITAEYCGLFPSDTIRSYLAPFGTWVDDRHDISLTAEVKF